MSRPRPRVAVLYNAPVLPREHPDYQSEAGVVSVARAIAKALNTQKFKAWPLAARAPVTRLVRSLSRQKPDVVFNLIEGFAGQSGGEAWITSLLDLMALPYTGCLPEAQGLCRHKGRTKALLAGFGLPTAPFRVLDRGTHLDDLPAPPWMVKPESEDASLGIDQGSILADRGSLAVRVGQLHEQYRGRVLIETYLPGREFNVGVLALPAPEALPISEVMHRPKPGDWPILTYAAKWAVGSDEDLSSPVSCPADVSPDLAEALGQHAVSAFRATGCRDYARVDFRLDAEGRPMILEVNPNPDLDPTAGLARAFGCAGRDYADTVAALVRQALARGCAHV